MSPLLLFLKIFRFLLSTFKFKFFFCIFLSLISAVAQLSGFGLIFVLINYLKNQALDFGDDKFSILLEKLNFILDKNDQIIFLIVPFVFLLGVIFRVIGQIYVSSFSEDVKNFTLKKILVNYFQSSYEYKIKLPRSHFNRIITLFADRLQQTCVSVLNLINNSILLVLTMFFLYLIDSRIIILFLFFAFLFLLILRFISRFILNYSIKQNENVSNLSNIMTKINFAFLDLKILNYSNALFDKFSQELEKKKTITIFQTNILSVPKYLIETIFILLIVFALYFIEGNPRFLIDYLPAIATISLLGLRLIPVFSSVNREFLIFKKNEDTLKKIFLNKEKLLKNINKKILHKKIDLKKEKKKWNFKKIITINNVNFKYKESKEIFNYNFRIYKNDWVLLLGKSGSGKTTFFNLLFGILKPNQGTIKFDNLNINRNQDKILRNIGYVPQSGYLFEGSLIENITLDEKINKKDEKKLKNIFEICELSKICNYDDFFKKIINFNSPNISGGQKQRVLLARILFKEPQILIFDESLNSLDKISEKNILKKIKTKMKVTLIYSSHHKVPLLFNRKLKL